MIPKHEVIASTCHMRRGYRSLVELVNRSEPLVMPAEREAAQ